MGLTDLLKTHGFEQNPFTKWRAEDEEGDLAEWFVPPAFFQDILGNVGTPRQSLKPASHIIFGMPGGGKTATRRMLESAVLAKSPSSLVIRYTDFNRVLQSNTPRPSLSKHVDELLRLGTIALLAMWFESSDRYERLTISERADLAGLVAEYYEVLPNTTKRTYTSALSPYAGRTIAIAKKTGRTLIEAYNATISVLKREKVEPAKWNGPSNESDKAEPIIRLQRFWSLANAMGIENVWILIDGVDEHPLTRSAQTIFDCLAEILLNQRLIEFREGDKQVMCFKVFLTHPEELRPLLDAQGFRSDRIPIRTIQWQRRNLDIALQKRLAYYSNRAVLSFDQICEGKLNGTHQRMLDECNLNPRTLFLMGYQIFAAFQSADSDATLLDKESIDEGIQLAKASGQAPLARSVSAGS